MSSTEADALSTGVHRHGALPVHVDARVLALFDIEMRQLSCRLETLVDESDQQTTVCLKSALVDARLRKLVSKPFANSRHELEPSPDKLRLKFAGVSLDLSSGDSSYTSNAACDAFDMFVSDKSPDILITALEASGHSLSRISSFWESRSGLLSRRRRYFVWASMHRLQGQTVAADPFATNLPSFLVQTGRPGRLRSDPSWKTLTIIRQSVRQMGPVDKKLLQSTLTTRISDLSEKELSELLPFMKTQWSDLYGPDEQGSQRIPAILQKLFPPLTSDTSPFFFRGALSLNCHRAKAILQSHEGDYNELTIGEFHAHLRASTMDYVAYEDGVVESTGAQKSEKALHILGSISVGDLGVSVYPSCVLFVRQVLRVRRQMGMLGMDDERPASSAKGISAPFRHVVVELALSASTLGLDAPAQQITFEARTSESAATIASVVTLPNFPAPPRGSLSVSLTAGKVSLRASQGKSQKSAKSLLAGIELRNVVIHGAMNEDPGILTKARVLLCLDQFKISVPRSVLRLYQFIDSWRTEYLP